MRQTYALYVITTGELITTGESDRCALAWQRKIERKLLKHAGRAERFKEAIRAGDTLVAWDSYDAFAQSGVSDEALTAECRRVFKGQYPRNE
jgi:hypothetical protein